ncbi:hypothetical protein ACFX1R_031763 [Malus domestica]
MNAFNMKQSLCQQDYTNKRTASQYIRSIIHSNTFIHKPTVLRKGSTYFVSFDTCYNVPRHLALTQTRELVIPVDINQVMKCEEGTHLHATTPSCHQPGDEMYNPYFLSYHQPGDEMYNLYFNIIWQLATHATNQVKKELIFMPQTS